MSTTDPRKRDAMHLREAGRYEEALSLLGQLFDEADSEPAPTRNSYFMTMLEWQFLLEVHPPAEAPLRARRDVQVEGLLGGAQYFGSTPGEDGDFRRAPRFFLIAEMNELLGDERSTYETFRQLDAMYPAQAQSFAHVALDATVAMRDFALAQRHCRDPLESLDTVNVNARELPLFPPSRQPPRLSGDLIGLVRDVRIGMAILRGRGEDAEADKLRETMLTGLESCELRDLARRELDAPGTIVRVVVERQMAEEDRARSL